MNPVEVQAEFMLNTFELSSEGLEQLLRGPVMENLVRRAIRVEAAAKRNATGYGAGPKVRTGRLRASIGYRVGEDGSSPFVDIGTGVHYAPFVEFGHRNSAHAYPLTGPGGKQVTVNGRRAFGYVGNKPTRPYPFLLPAAEAARSV